MGYTFSTDQQSIIDARNQNVLVSAAAGSGKTSVLTERIVGLVNDEKNPVDIDKILVVTFTNAAAKEMKERIGKRINELVEANPGNSHLQKQSTLIHGAQITTIDSFCLYLLKNHFHKIDVDPAFRIAGEGEIKLIKADVLKDVIKRAYASKDEAFYHMVDCYSKKDNDDSLENSILKIYSYACSYPWPEAWLEKRRTDYAYASKEELEGSELVLSAKTEVYYNVEIAIYNMEEARKECLKPGRPYTYEETILKDIEAAKGIQEFIAGHDFDEIRKFLSEFKFDTCKRAPKDCDESEKKYISGLRDAYKKAITSIGAEFFSFSLEEAYEDLKATNVVVNKLIDLVMDFHVSFEKEKRSRNIIDFSDMEHMAIKILIDEYEDEEHYKISDVAKSLRDYFEEVMVDEYQDSNLVQELIIQSVSKEKESLGYNRFMVGDIKQSIYRFRLARPEIFSGKMQLYEKSEEAHNRLITLKKNFRSRSSVIDSVNVVFSEIMTKDYGGVNYDEDAMLYRGGEFPEDTKENKTELCLIRKEDKAVEGREKEALVIAQKIKEAVRTIKVYDKDKKEMRKASYGDICVLFRSPTKWRDILKEAFENANIPYEMEGSGDFYNTTEIRKVISFLKVIDNPLNDIELYAAMTSDFGRMTDEECARIKGLAGASERFLWDKANKYAEVHEDKELSSFISLVNKYRKLSYVLPINELIDRLFDETGYKNIVAAMPSGKKRLLNVNMLVTKACEYAKTSFYGLFHFLRYIELLEKIEEEEGEAKGLLEASDAVKIMSIHKSKGLEFPICIIGGMDEPFNERDLADEFVTNIDAGIGASFIDPEKRIKRSTLLKKYIICNNRRESVGEEIRVLYVGMTRAKEKLIMVGMCDEPKDWLERELSTTQKSYLSLIKPAVVRNLGNVFVGKVCGDEDLSIEDVKEELDRNALKLELIKNAKNPDDVLLQDLENKFSFKYPHEGLSKLYTKTTVSELKMAAIELNKEEGESVHPFKENESSEYIPLFAGGELEVKGTDRGTAYHSVMQLIDYSKIYEASDLKEELENQLKRMVDKKELSPQDVEKVSVKKVHDFLLSDCARDMARAEKENALYKEQPFVIGVPASTVNPEFPEEETLLVQGVIDVYFICDGKVTVLDYKTDRVDNAEELIKRYRKQLEYYAMAIGQLTNLPVEKMLIYSFALNKIIEL